MVSCRSPGAPVALAALSQPRPVRVRVCASASFAPGMCRAQIVRSPTFSSPCPPHSSRELQLCVLWSVFAVYCYCAPYRAGQPRTRGTESPASGATFGATASAGPRRARIISASGGHAFPRRRLGRQKARMGKRGWCACPKRRTRVLHAAARAFEKGGPNPRTGGRGRGRSRIMSRAALFTSGICPCPSFRDALIGPGGCAGKGERIPTVG
ncbi:hypothetical protein C8Q77DRAFT_362240 [Trametes polyzona]|nr:hypothetical protein C8Q77DRAFT_362240 [Trametes polyzona]